MANQLIQPKALVPNLTSNIQQLTTNLQALKPNNSENVQLITYALIATALVGIMVYHYIREQEKLI